MSYDFDYVSLDEKADDFQEGWEALQDALASDEEWAQYLFEAYHGQDA